MDSLLTQPMEMGFASLQSNSYQSSKAQVDSVIIAGLSDTNSNTTESSNQLRQSLSVTAEQVLAKLNELLADKLPAGVESLKPEDNTSEQTARRIVSGIASLFDGFSKQNAKADPEEMIAKFMELARKGVEQGYDDAYATLQDIGAFEFEGVQSGVEQTKILIEDKLKQLETQLRKRYGLEAIDAQTDIAAPTTSNLLAQGGALLLDVVA